MIEEIWRDVVGYEGFYKISNLGKVISVNRIDVRGQHRKPVEKSQRLNNGYFVTTLHKDKVRKTMKVHRLVAMAFIPNPENKPQVNHKDGNKLNNHLDNLEWCTAKENTIHARDNNLLSIVGVNNYQTNLTERDVQIMRWMVNIAGFSYQSTADFFETTKSTVGYIIKGRSWKHLPIDYSCI